MNGVLVLWTGKRGSAAWEELVGEYRLRVGRHMPAEERRLRPVEGRSGDRSRVLAQEAMRVALHVEPADAVVALDERGIELGSEELARWLGERRLRVVAIVGSDLGLDPDLLRRANLRLALSRLTLPHQLARLILWEQLYRASDLLAGGSYHRGFAEAGKSRGRRPVVPPRPGP
ncbi:MAG: 23S rRNA (pseudouridine(1915)-N(3))-methyltransferase RlmH [Thermoanaerobaculaceae bacterium]|nr:23S rRNA (pseudouridine(1915)-N(3))-methyltransferase RlmH [Thermoanaerobaculaceae bacterium]MDI9620397.1 23S rRNA (pseudouridine(1915)-N(3))-methyltransferase RlmH [Acidobacteriota bacterium]NLH12377.1 23S rRNA (pseudouridine(1915)-N(3))-methyltransferase RlmH [Holophagae bacterium]HPW55115.1 23S rRNA (pseudouridine(1915)-N(3))-methyltransferase RlmH [Thermoanaerobaculaceae bacterium]